MEREVGWGVSAIFWGLFSGEGVVDILEDVVAFGWFGGASWCGFAAFGFELEPPLAVAFGAPGASHDVVASTDDFDAQGLVGLAGDGQRSGAHASASDVDGGLGRTSDAQGVGFGCRSRDDDGSQARLRCASTVHRARWGAVDRGGLSGQDDLSGENLSFGGDRASLWPAGKRFDALACFGECF